MTKFKIELDRQYQGQDFNPEIKTVFKWIDTADYNQALIEAGRLAEDPRNSNPRIIEMVTDDGNRFNVYSAEVIKGKVAGLKANFKKHNKKADKLGALHSWIETGTERTVKYYHPDDTLQLYPMVKVYQQITIYYQVPRIEGWILTARFEIEDAPGKIDETGQASPMQTDVFTYTAPGETLPASYQDKTAIECQHCGHNRFRKKSYLLRNLESGEFKEVGSTCLIDFFGHDPKAFVFAAMFDPERFISEAAEDYDEYSHPAGPYGIF